MNFRRCLSHVAFITKVIADMSPSIAFYENVMGAVQKPKAGGRSAVEAGRAGGALLTSVES